MTLVDIVSILVLIGIAVFLIALLWLIINITRYDSPKVPLIVMGIGIATIVICCIYIYENEDNETAAGDSNNTITHPSESIPPEKHENLPSGKFSEVSVVVTGKNFLDYNYRDTYDDFIELPYIVINDYDKDIRGIEGEVFVKDMFGKTIISIKWDITEEIIPAHSSIDFYGKGIDYNEYLNSHNKLSATPFEDLYFEYRFSKILFTDGAIIQQ